MKLMVVLASFAMLFVAGCHSYDIVQGNVFADDDGNVVTVEYGRAEKEHVNTFVSPITGKEMEFKSRLVIEVTLPDGDDFVAWQCMNFRSRGTMYRTDDDEWKVLATGFSCIVYHQSEKDETKYNEVFRGVLCDTRESEYKPNEKWRSMKKSANGGWQ